MVNDNDSLVVTDWMVKELKLKGTELMIYAIIYGFCKSEGCCRASLAYLGDWTGTSKSTVIEVINELIKKQLIVKEETEVNGETFNKYIVNDKVSKLFNKDKYLNSRLSY